MKLFFFFVILSLMMCNLNQWLLVIFSFSVLRLNFRVMCQEIIINACGVINPMANPFIFYMLPLIDRKIFILFLFFLSTHSINALMYHSPFDGSIHFTYNTQKYNILIHFIYSITLSELNEQHTKKKK